MSSVGATPPDLVAYEAEMDRVAVARQLGRARFEELEPSATIDHEIDLARPIAPERDPALRTVPFAVAELLEDEGFPERQISGDAHGELSALARAGVLGKDGRALLVQDVSRLEKMVEEVRSGA